MAVTITVEPDAVSNASAWTVTSDKDDATAKTVTAFADYSGTVAGTVKVTTSAAHTYLTNDVVVITGTTNYDGTYDLTKIDADEFYITVTWVADDATGTVTLTNPNFRIKAELIISAVTVAVKWQSKGTLSWDFKRILWELITYTTIDFDVLNIETTNTDSYKSYTIKFTEFWESTANALVTGANDTSDTKVIYKVDCDTFADYNLSADNEEFLTERPDENKIQIGDNLVTGWTNVGGDSAFDTLVTSGRNITSAIDSSATNTANCYSNNIGHVSKGDIITAYCNLERNSGSLPFIGLIEGTSIISWKSDHIQIATGYNYIEITASEDIEICRVRINSTTTNQCNFSMIQVYISKGYNELDYLAFISEETIMGAYFKQYDINDNLLDTIGLDEVTISGDRGIMPISALLFTHSNTQVEKIILNVRKYADIITNGDFADWTADNPDGWNVSEIPPGNEITEVGSDEGHGGVGTGSCNFYSDGSAIVNINNSDRLTIGNFYIVRTKVTKLITRYIRAQMGTGGSYIIYDEEKNYSSFSVCDGSDGDFKIESSPIPPYDACDVTIDDVEVLEGTDMSKDITFIRNGVCWNNPVRLEWLNKFGAFDAYTFLDDYNESRSGKRSTYKNTSDVEQILDIENYQTIEAFSNYETKTNIDWIKTILDSKKVYWIIDNVRNEVVVTNLSQVKKKKERVQLAINFRQLI